MGRPSKKWWLNDHSLLTWRMHDMITWYLYDVYVNVLHLCVILVWLSLSHGYHTWCDDYVLSYPTIIIFMLYMCYSLFVLWGICSKCPSYMGTIEFSLGFLSLILTMTHLRCLICMNHRCLFVTHLGVCMFYMCM